MQMNYFHIKVHLQTQTGQILNELVGNLLGIW